MKLNIIYKKIFIIAICFFLTPLSVKSNTIVNDFFYVKTIGTSDIDNFCSYDVTSDGGLIIGSFTKAYNSGNDDTCLTKIDRNGDVEWANIFIRPSEDRWIIVKESHIGGYISMESSDATIINRFTETGEVTSSNKYSISIFGRSIFLEFSDGALIIINTVDNNIHLYKLNPFGSVTWQQSCSLASNLHNFMPKNIINTNDGGFAIVGYLTYIDNNYLREGLFLKFDYSGNLQIKNKFTHKDPNKNVLIQSITQNSNDEYRIVCGIDPYQCFMKLDKNGNVYSTKALLQSPFKLSSISKTDKENDYILSGTNYSDSSLIFIAVNDNDVAWKTLYNNFDVRDYGYIKKRKQFTGYVSVYSTKSKDIGIAQINSRGLISDKCGTELTENLQSIDIYPQQSHFEFNFKKVEPNIKIEKYKEKGIDISKYIVNKTICSSLNSNDDDDDDSNENSMFMGVTWFLNGKHIKVIPDGFEGKIIQLHSWWGNHGVQLDLNNDNKYEHKNYDKGYRNCNKNPDTCVDYAYRDFNFNNGFSLKDFYLWVHYWHDPTHGNVKCFRHDCMYKPYGAGATFQINTRDFQCLDNEWYYQTYPILNDSGDTIYCKQFNVCGDGVVSDNEECDDFNQENGDGCDSKCRKE